MPGENPLDLILAEHPDLQLLRSVADEIENRTARPQRLPIYRHQDSRVGVRALVPPGSAVLFVARPDTPALLGIRRAMADGDQDAMDSAAEEIYGNLVDRQPRSLDDAVSEFVHQGTCLELAYLGTPLVQNVFLPDDLKIAAFPMPYTGGPLDEASFRLVARSREGDDSWLDAVLVINDPELTEMERAALELVPLEESAVNIGKSAMCYAITAVTVFIVVAGATYACPGGIDLLHLDDDIVQELTPAKSSRQLLGLRRQALERRPG